MNARSSSHHVALVLLLMAYDGARAFMPAPTSFVPSASPLKIFGQHASFKTNATPFLGTAGLPSPSLCPSSLGPAGAMRSPRLQRKKQALSRLRRDSGGLGTRMTASDENNASGAGMLAENVGPLALGVGCAVVASAVSEISLHAAAFVQLFCLSVWLGMSVYTTFVWPIITGIKLRDSSDFADLLSELAPSYLQLSAAMIMSLGTSSVVIGHANNVQLIILAVALGITVYNSVVLEPTTVDAFREDQARKEKQQKGGRGKGTVGSAQKTEAELANFIGAEVLLDLLSILCAVCYAWDLASTITFS